MRLTQGDTLKTDPVSNLARSLDELAYAVTDAHTVLDALSASMEPLLLPVPPNGETRDNAPTPLMSPLRCAVAQQAESVAGLALRLRSLMDRLDV